MALLFLVSFCNLNNFEFTVIELKLRVYFFYVLDSVYRGAKLVQEVKKMYIAG